MEVKILSAIENLLNSQKSIYGKEYLDITETARYLGISKQTLYIMNYLGILPRYRTESTKKNYYLKSDLLDYLSKNRLMSKQEI